MKILQNGSQIKIKRTLDFTTHTIIEKVKINNFLYDRGRLYIEVQNNKSETFYVNSDAIVGDEYNEPKYTTGNTLTNKEDIFEN